MQSVLASKNECTAYDNNDNAKHILCEKVRIQYCLISLTYQIQYQQESKPVRSVDRLENYWASEQNILI